MRGLGAIREADDPLGRMTDILDEAGFTSVVATNCDQIYHRYLKPGEEVTISSVLEDVVGPKKTGLGEGWFFTTRSFWRVGEELVSEMMFRILKFAPPVSESSSTDVPADLDASRMLRPTASLDTQFFWDGVAAHELRIQLRADVGTAPAGARDLERQVGADRLRGRVRSGNGLQLCRSPRPKVPGRSLPFVVALVELPEGVRMLGELRGIDPSSVSIGMEVEAVYLDFPGDDETGGTPWTLYAWQPVSVSAVSAVSAVKE